jgi:hypothetical protein
VCEGAAAAGRETKSDERHSSQQAFTSLCKKKGPKKSAPEFLYLLLPVYSFKAPYYSAHGFSNALGVAASALDAIAE